jgi:RIO kinase 1
MANPFLQDSARLDHKVESLRLHRSVGAQDDARKVLDEVFDHRTLMAVYKFMTSESLDTIDFPISTGKEGNVFRVTTHDGDLLALKIYRINTATFHSIAKYIEGDPRFKGLTGSKRKLIYAWAIKEFKNLCRCQEAGVRCPKPIRFHENLLLMEYIGTPEQPAPAIRSVRLEDPAAVYKEIVKFIKMLYKKAELVHGDLSEYNILWHEEKPWIIDVGQSMVVDHPNSEEFLKRDIKNVNRYFRSLDVKIKSEEEILRFVKGVKK